MHFDGGSTRPFGFDALDDCPAPILSWVFPVLAGERERARARKKSGCCVCVWRRELSKVRGWETRVWGRTERRLRSKTDRARRATEPDAQIQFHSLCGIYIL